MNINVRTNPDLPDLEERFDVLDAKIDQLDLSSLIPIVAAEAGKVFATEGYGSWPALSPDYAEWKARNYPGQTILRLTDAYYKAATQPGGPNNFIQMTSNILTYGVQGLDYPIRHEEGQGVPPRPVFELMAASEVFQQMLERGVHNLVTQSLHEVGLRR